MDQDVFQNWVKIKKSMEQQNKTNNPFYKRACIIVRTGNDPNKINNGKN
jgi:hypothetical protein